ncbi:MAG: HAD family phosphatase [Planctomycetes bacterium]|nr:HAD family phosphatase [Planctomycetota bacterium]
MGVKGLIFDLDGVLVDSEPLHLRAAQETLGRFGGWVTEEENRAFIGKSEEDFWRAFAPRHGIGLSFQELLRLRIDRFLAILEAEGVSTLPGVGNAVGGAHARGVRLAVASSSPRILVEALLARAGLRPFFPVALAAEDVRAPKPDPEVFLLAASRLGLPPADLAVVEDSASGARAALAAGMCCWVVPNADSLAHVFPIGIRRILSCAEIPGLLAGEPLDPEA